MIAPISQCIIYIACDLILIALLITNKLKLSHKMKRFALILLGWSLIMYSCRLPYLFLIYESNYWNNLFGYISNIMLVIIMYMIVLFHLEVTMLNQIIKAFCVLSTWITTKRLVFVQIMFLILCLASIYPFLFLDEWFEPIVIRSSTVIFLM